MHAQSMLLRRPSARLRPATHLRVTTNPASPVSATSYGGRCARCGGTHALPATPGARAAADALRQALERHRRLDFGGSSSSSSSSSSDASSPSYSTLPFLPRSQGGNGGPGRMLGVLVCKDGTVLRAFSGQLALSAASSGEGGGGWRCPGWAGPVATLTNDTPQYARFRALSDALTRRIDDCVGRGGRASEARPVQQQRQRQATQLRARRRALSHALISRVQDSYETRDLLGRRVALRQAYLALAAQAEASLPVTRLPRCASVVGVIGGGGNDGDGDSWLGFPTGTGDCCAPKLLHEAALRGLEPAAMAEFWFGAPSADGAGASRGSDTDSEGPDGEADDDLGDGVDDKEAAWRRRQRRRVLKASRRRRRAEEEEEEEDATTTEAPSRVHGAFYGPCAKCAGILGTLLCDCDCDCGCGA